MTTKFISGMGLKSVLLRHFSQLYPTHSRLVYNPTGTILVIFYSKVSSMLPAKYQSNRPNGSGVDWLVVLLFYVHGKHLRSCRDGQLT